MKNMSTFDSKVFDTLSHIAEASDHHWAKLSAAVVIKRKTVGIGYNRMKTDPMQAKYGKNCEAIYLHAEIAAIKNSLRNIEVDDLENATLYICRRKKDSNKKFVNGLAKPCEGCMRAIVEFGIKKVVYTNDEGGYEVL